jgi:hypothetical protein
VHSGSGLADPSLYPSSPPACEHLETLVASATNASFTRTSQRHHSAKSTRANGRQSHGSGKTGPCAPPASPRPNSSFLKAQIIFPNSRKVTSALSPSRSVVKRAGALHPSSNHFWTSAPVPDYVVHLWSCPGQKTHYPGTSKPPVAGNNRSYANNQRSGDEPILPTGQW